MNYYQVKTKNNEKIIIKSDYKRITKNNFKAFRYFVESFINEPILMDFIPSKDNNSFLTVTVTKNMIQDYKKRIGA